MSITDKQNEQKINIIKRVCEKIEGHVYFHFIEKSLEWGGPPMLGILYAVLKIVKAQPMNFLVLGSFLVAWVISIAFALKRRRGKLPEVKHFDVPLPSSTSGNSANRPALLIEHIHDNRSDYLEFSVGGDISATNICLEPLPDPWRLELRVPTSVHPRQPRRVEVTVWEKDRISESRSNLGNYVLWLRTMKDLGPTAPLAVTYEHPTSNEKFRREFDLEFGERGLPGGHSAIIVHARPIQPPMQPLNVQAIQDSDPRIIFEFEPAKSRPIRERTRRNRRILASNRGATDALDVQVESLKLSSGQVHFKKLPIIKALAENSEVVPEIRTTEGQNISPLFQCDLEMLFQKEWQNTRTSSSAEPLIFPINISYLDHKEQHFFTSASIVYNPYSDTTEVMDFKFGRI